MSVRPRLLLALLCLPAPLFAQAGAPVDVGSPADARLRQLYEREWAWRQREFGGGRGEDGGAETFPRIDAASQARRLAYWTDVLREIDTIPVAQLSAGERVNAAVFRTSIAALAANGRFRTWEMPFNADSQFWSNLAGRGALRDAAQYRRALGRMRDLPRYFDEQIANMRLGLERGFTVPRATLEGRDASIAAYVVADPDRNPFFAPFAAIPATVSATDRDALQAEARAAIASAVVPAYTRLLAFYRNEYLPGARKTLAAEAMPGGKAFYLAQIREYTTTDLSPEQIHQIGLAEVARIDAEMKTVIAKSGFTGSFAEFQTFLRTDPRFYAKTGKELLSLSAYVAKKVDGELKNNFNFLPRYRFTIRPVPDAIAPFYTAGRGGLESCSMNTYDLPQRPLYQIPALTLHECNPGHSFQAAVAREQPDHRPEFRRSTYFSGYGEGWGLYTEWLGTKMGIYETPYEDFGRLSYEMWRACRLVIDTGIHHYGWSRQQAIDYLAAHTALSRHEIETEVDRYISWPGQALAYKLGELTIRRLRSEAEQRLGARFDPRGFHDTFLALGSVPLPVLETQMHAWIDAQAAPVPTKPDVN